jgi:hypothetical protein
LIGSIAVALLAGHPAAAQAPLQPRDIQLDNAGRCDLTALVKLSEMGPEKLAKGLGFTYVIGTPQVRSAVDRRSAMLANQPAPFAHVVICGRDEKTKQLLLGFTHRNRLPTVCGWADPQMLLVRRSGCSSQATWVARARRCVSSHGRGAYAHPLPTSSRLRRFGGDRPCRNRYPAVAGLRADGRRSRVAVPVDALCAVFGRRPGASASACGARQVALAQRSHSLDTAS